MAKNGNSLPAILRAEDDQEFGAGLID